MSASPALGGKCLQAHATAVAKRARKSTIAMLQQTRATKMGLRTARFGYSAPRNGTDHVLRQQLVDPPSAATKLRETLSSSRIGSCMSAQSSFLGLPRGARHSQLDGFQCKAHISSILRHEPEYTHSTGQALADGEQHVVTISTWSLLSPTGHPREVKSGRLLSRVVSRGHFPNTFAHRMPERPPSSRRATLAAAIWAVCMYVRMSLSAVALVVCKSSLDPSDQDSEDHAR